MPDITINGVSVNFPFVPYSVQEEYMAKVIECLQNSTHGVLESPTGTGKTLSLLCSTLSWLLTKKAQIQARALVDPNTDDYTCRKLQNELEKGAGPLEQATNFGWAPPKIIYASRTHSQLSQAMQELKRTSYKHVRTAVLGSRDQLCIHPEVSRESSSTVKVQMCQSKIKSGKCFYYNNVEKGKLDPTFSQGVLDIEDLVKAGRKTQCCPYFLSKELMQTSDITFMPYNYLLDPRTRRSQGIYLENNVVLLDEAHNVERVCEEAASLQISSTDIAVCIDEITMVMKKIADTDGQADLLQEDSVMVAKDFTLEDLCILKTMFLNLEKTIDDVEIKNIVEGETLPGGYIFELLEKAELTYGKAQFVIEKLEKVILYLFSNATSALSRRGNALQKFCDVLKSIFSSGSSNVERREKIKECYKVYIQTEDQRKAYKADIWGKSSSKKIGGKIINYWCFSPGYGMEQLIQQGVRSIILTSGTLSPLKPFISELGIPIGVQLENPHIVKEQQICVGILKTGPDGENLNSSFQTRSNIKYITSLGQVIYNFSSLVPHGLLVFFPSYSVMRNCTEEWQKMGLWTKIAERKPIYVEAQSKEGMTNTMAEYYQKIQDPSNRGAIFMAVCRGKVSEGLDFANAYGRAVLVTGLPYPPLKDPRIILKQKYLEEMRSKDKVALSGRQWYQLEASRAVNQAVGRIIRHRDDYGAILLCDCRFNNPTFKEHLSAWLRPHVKVFDQFGTAVRELRNFFRNIDSSCPRMYDSSLPAASASFDTTTIKSRKTASKPTSETDSDTFPQNDRLFDINTYTVDIKNENTQIESKRKPVTCLFDTDSKAVINFSGCKMKDSPGFMNKLIETTNDKNVEPAAKKRKIKVLPLDYNAQPSNASALCTENGNSSTSNDPEHNKETQKDIKKESLSKDYLKNVKQSLSSENYEKFAKMIQDYTKNGDFIELMRTLESLFPLNGRLQHFFIGFKKFVKKQHISLFEEHISKNNVNLLMD